MGQLVPIRPKRFVVTIYWRDGSPPLRTRLVALVEVLPQGNGDCEGKPCVRIYFTPSLEPICYPLEDIAQIVVQPNVPK